MSRSRAGVLNLAPSKACDADEKVEALDDDEEFKKRCMY